MFKDYYEILEVDIEATGNQIKDSYRRLIKKWHPDLCSHPNAKSRSQEIIEAYLILSDTDAREKFDNEYYRFYEAQKAYENEKNDNAFQKSYKTDDSFNSQEENKKTTDQFREAYTFSDKIFEKWVENAREQAKKFAMQAISDTIGATKSGCLYTGKAFIIAIIVFIAILLLIKIISHGI